MSGRDGRVEEVEGEAGEAGTLSVSFFVFLICISLIISNLEALFISMSFEEMSWVFCPFFDWVVCCFGI